jgi:DNA-directed RNA polymerase subunit A"
VQLGRNLKKVLIKGIEAIPRVVIQKEGLEYVLYTEGTALQEVFDIEGVNPARTISNHPGEMCEVFGIEAARNSIVKEIMETLREQGLNVDVKHIMLASDMMTCDGEVKQIGRHGLSGEKASILARAAFEVTVNHLIDAGIRGDIDELSGVTENVIVGQPINLGTGDVHLVAKPPA